MSRFPYFKQPDAMDCGPTCLRMIAKFYGKTINLDYLREQSHISREGVSLLGISDAAEAIGMRSLGTKVTFEQLVKDVPKPSVVHWDQNHFVVVYEARKGNVYVADPAFGLVKYTDEEFKKHWLATVKNGELKGICLLLQPTPAFYDRDDEKTDHSGFSFLWRYVRPHRRLVSQLLLGFLAASIIQLIFPFLTQSLVDVGINNQDVGFIYLVLVAQLMLFIGQTSIDFIRSWILLHISTRINISIISDFLIKLMRLPIGFFDTKMIGDLMQRIQDHRRIERFLTTQTLNILFSVFNLLVFGIVLALYSWKILFVFLLGSAAYVVWVFVFMKKRRQLDYKKFSQLSENQSMLIQLITGMQEIKLNNYEKQKRWEWERIQARLFRVNVENLTIDQYQQAGSVFINQTKNIIITVIAAMAVLNGDMTLGMMLAVQYIIGQLNGPLNEMINFMHLAQDAKMSLERLGEIHKQDDEEVKGKPLLNTLPSNKSLQVQDLVFQYEGPHSPKVLNQISLTVPERKLTAIVGTSGSGKTTLVKLLLGFYPPVQGKVRVGDTDLQNFSQQWWRTKVGAVMQDGFIFSDTIANNIAVGAERLDKERLLFAAKTANILEFVESLPLGFNTKIGQDGHGLSQGQKQRILIARVIYKDPEYLFFDEATNALDANNEKVIMENLDKVYEGKTVVVVAHRLSTVKHADQIVVLDRGEIVELGTHEELTAKRGAYYNLVKNQLELGN
ncbi:peptidase domain-containing ABC transporter [Gaoshiqia sediminis]|uniref:Peptidase domain-containing ABC transporter n=1 Tax=Gaoshiqia sediminis TaxID=2986998 RepID=A0AA42C5I3_9BACT|nr:peptidase domain-containing ABC transporter [Gaoshiqia sediminis]MCW0482868.1 peptidase domain-containing ABC transporter [Gaoshiqia sediminis]